MNPHQPPTRALPRIIITPGEPAGVGPDVTLQALQHPWRAELIVVADPLLIQERAKQLNLNVNIIDYDPNHSTQHQPRQIKIIPVALSEKCIAGKLNKKNAGYVIQCLDVATDLCLKHSADALVTGPVQKSILNEANFSFQGHTEFLAQRCKVQQSLMLFVLKEMKVVLMTTHIALADVSKTITTEKIIATIQLLKNELQKKFALKNPAIYVCGLNPHAGESGHIGREEIEIIEPALQKLREQNINVKGPFPADTIFTEKYLKEADVIVAMYHDQALPLIKYLGFDRAVNVTLGLPIIRTSVDHGTALDVAGSGHADVGSLISAIELAIKLSESRA